MGNIVNLRQARKAKARSDKDRVAQANRAKFGRTKAERQADAEQEARRNQVLDGAFREHRGERSVSEDHE